MKIRAASLFTVLFLFLLVSSCVSVQPGNRFGGKGKTEEAPENPGYMDLSQLQKRLIAEAHDMIGKEPLTGGGKTFPSDCIGTVLALYARVDIDLSRDFGKYQGNGVARLYNYLENKGLLYHTKDPVPGDIVFWDNTWDANKDGKFNDQYTHAGVIINRLEGNILEYIHYNYRKGVVFERMNLYDPDTRTMMVRGKKIIVNSPIRARNVPRVEGKSLASQLIKSYGRGYELEE